MAERILRAVNHSKKVVLADRVSVADSFMKRCKGLLGSNHLNFGEGLWISPCTCIHTVFMQYPIDVLLINPQGRVLYAKTVMPWRISGFRLHSNGALELAPGTLNRSDTHVGDLIQLVEYH